MAGARNWATGGVSPGATIMSRRAGATAKPGTTGVARCPAKREARIFDPMPDGRESAVPQFVDGRDTLHPSRGPPRHQKRPGHLPGPFFRFRRLWGCGQFGALGAVIAGGAIGLGAGALVPDATGASGAAAPGACGVVVVVGVSGAAASGAGASVVGSGAGAAVGAAVGALGSGIVAGASPPIIGLILAIA
jgi:hypothetical protein